jgi:hypothetical protein
VNVVDIRVLRFATAVGLSLAMAYALALPLPYLAPLFAVFLSASPGPPPGPKQLVILLLVMTLSMGLGLLLVPLLRYYPVTAILTVGACLFFANYVALILGKAVPGMFLIVGFTFISITGSLHGALATSIILAMGLGIAMAVLSLWLAFAVFPDGVTAAPEKPVSEAQSNWLALRATLVVMPAYLLALTNPAQYLMTIMKSVSLGQQASVVDARHAGRELIGSTFVGGVMAVLFWCLLKFAPTLWMFSLWTAAFALFTAAKLYRLLPTRFAPSFWINALVTMLILLGPAVEDSANGKDALAGFLVRFTTFVGVTLYAWGAIAVLEYWRERRLRPRNSSA